jgi:hypothetical protein
MEQDFKKKISDQFMKTLLINKTSRQRFKNAQAFYWNCIDKYGYSEKKKVQEYEQEYESDPEDEYSQFKTMCKKCGTELSLGKDCKKCEALTEYSQFKPQNIGFQESQHITKGNIYGFNRTFIGPYDDSATGLGNRLSEIQKWVTVDPKETELKKIYEIFEASINAMGLGDNESILRTAVNMYFNIMNYYDSNLLKLPSLRGDLKKGYIILCVYYSLLANKLNISIEHLVRFIPDARLSYIPKANEYILKIFENASGYSFLNTKEEPVLISSLCGLVKLLPKNTIRDINKVKRDVFDSVLTPIQIAACIYYITTKIATKRLSIVIPETGVVSKLTVDFLSSKCGSFSAGTLAKNVKIIEDFYTQHPELKDF